jgi:hypothetical protein
VEWNRRIRVRTVTADALIAQYGRPAFIKIDVEGGEPAVLDGLDDGRCPALSFEYLPGAIDEVRACVDRLAALAEPAARYEFNWSVGESYELASPEWLDASGSSPRSRRSGPRRDRGMCTRGCGLDVGAGFSRPWCEGDEREAPHRREPAVQPSRVRARGAVPQRGNQAFATRPPRHHRRPGRPLWTL